MIDPHRDQPVVRTGPSLTANGAAIIMVHGRNAAPANILDLAARLDRPAATYLAPAAANRTWYPHSFLAEIAQNEPYLTSALDRLSSLVAEIEQEGVPSRRIALLGFSQGACLAAEFVCRHPARYGGLIVFSGGLIGPPGTTWPHEGSLAGTPIFLGCSDTDAHLPESRVRESARVFERMGADVTVRIYPGVGHLVVDDEIHHAQSIIDRMLA